MQRLGSRSTVSLFLILGSVGMAADSAEPRSRTLVGGQRITGESPADHFDQVELSRFAAERYPSSQRVRA